MAKYSARFTPVGDTWVGGKESYKACCDKCFWMNCYFTNPLLLLDNPNFYQEFKSDILTVTKLTEDQFSEAVGAAIIALQRGNMISTVYCPCGQLHLDKE